MRERLGHKMKKKTVWLILVLVNILALFFGAAVIGYFPQADLSAACTYQTEKLQEYSTSAAMKPGVYQVFVDYSVVRDAASYRLTCKARTGDGGSYPIIFADEYRMDPRKNHLEFCLWVNSEIDDLLISLETRNEDSVIWIESIMLKRQFRETFCYLMLRICAALFMVDIAVVAVWKRRELARWLRAHFYIVMGLTGIFCISAMCVLSDSQVSGHDTIFHLSRIVGLAEGLKDGEFPVRIQPGWCNGYGYPVSIFYGDVFLYPSAVLYMIGVPLVYAYKAYLLLVHIATVGVAYYCYRKLCEDRYIGLLCTAMFSLSVNRILNVYLRGAMGEYSAYLFLPLVLLGMKEILCSDQEKKGSRYGWLYLGVGMTGVLRTHILSFEMVCIILGITVIILIGRVARQGRWKEIGKGAALAILLCAGFIVPFLDYSRQEIMVFGEKYEYGIQQFGLTLYELFSLPTEGTGVAMRTAEGFGGKYPVSLGLGMIVMMALMAWVLVKKNWETGERRTFLFVAGLAGVSIWMSTCFFPWNRLAAVPGVRNVVASIQFPMRFLSLGIPLLIYAAGLALGKMKAVISPEKMKYLLIGLYLITAVQGMYCVDLVMRRGGNLVVYDGSTVLYEDDNVVQGEYLLRGTDRCATEENQEVQGQNVLVTDVGVMGNQMTAACTASADAWLEFPRFAYDYYRCIDTETGREFTITSGINNRIRVELPDGYQGTLEVLFEEPWYWRLATFFSLLTLVLICARFFLIKILKNGVKISRIW